MKFPKGSIIRIASEDDQAYRENNFYEVYDYDEQGYHLKSVKRDRVYEPSFIIQNINARTTYDIPCDNNTEFVDNAYRLINDTERVLYDKIRAK